MVTEQTLIFGTDGSCLKNPDGPTGWSYVCQDGRYAYGGRPAGTNQVGELMAILTVLTDFPAHPLEIQSDSAYAIGCSSTWKAGWQRAGYVRKTGPLANLDIIREIHRLIDARSHPVAFVKVKAHLQDETVHPLNVRADELAGRGARAAAERRAEFGEHGTWALGDPEPIAGPPPVPAGPAAAAVRVQDGAPVGAAVRAPVPVPEAEPEPNGFLF